MSRRRAAPLMVLGTSLALLLVSPMGCTPPQAQSTDRPSLDASASPYVAGELIVKLVPEAGELLDAALAAGKTPTDTGLAWFDALNQRYGVNAIEAAFSHQPDLEEIKRTYPQRARRAPPEANVPSLKYIYKLTLRPDADIVQVAADYAAHPDVAYAEPNYLATIQRL